MDSKINRRKFLKMTAVSAVALMINTRVGQATHDRQPATDRQAIFKESPTLAQQVRQNMLPPVEERLPAVPLVLTPLNGVKNYGGYMRTMSSWLGGYMEESQYGHSPLRWVDDGLTIGPGMCDTWSTNANNTEWTVHIREELKWSDGAPVTVDDILFWWNDLVWANYPDAPDGVPDFGQDGENLATFTKVDSYTLKIVYTNPAPLTGYRLAMWVKGNIGPRWIAPKHYLQQFHPKYNTSYTDFSTLQEKILFRTNPDCPSLDSWVCSEYSEPNETSSGYIIWRRNPYYYAVDPDGKQLPYLDGVIETGVADRDSAMALIQEGKIDFSLFNSNLLLSDIPVLEAGQAGGDYDVRLWDGGSGTGMMYFWNFDHPEPKKRVLFRTPAFKQAMSLALNRPLIQANVYHGYGFPTTGTMSPKAIEFNINEEGRNRFAQYRDAYVGYTPAAAGALLDGIGVVDINEDGWREYADGSALEIHIDIPEGASDECMQVLAIAVPNWQAIGLNVQINQMPGDQFNAHWASGQGDIKTNWEVGDGPNHLVYPSWMAPNEAERWAPLCGNTLQMGRPSSGSECEVNDPWSRNPPHFCADEALYDGTPVEDIHDLYLQAISEPSETTRIQLVWQILDIHKENVFYIGTVANLPRIVIVGNNLGNVPTRDDLALGGFLNPWILPYPALLNPETWSFQQVHQVFLPAIRR